MQGGHCVQRSLLLVSWCRFNLGGHAHWLPLRYCLCFWDVQSSLVPVLPLLSTTWSHYLIACDPCDHSYQNCTIQHHVSTVRTHVCHPNVTTLLAIFDECMISTSYPASQNSIYLLSVILAEHHTRCTRSRQLVVPKPAAQFLSSRPPLHCHEEAQIAPPRSELPLQGKLEGRLLSSQGVPR
jgi:hypothetical protein